MFLDLLIPNRCIECDAIISSKEIICEVCYSKINFVHEQNGKTSDFFKKCQLRFPVENAFALMYYDEKGLSRKIIHHLKYAGRSKIGLILAKWVKENIPFLDLSIDIITGIPLHSKKQKERGYNQLHLFVEKIAEDYQIPYSHNLLRRNFYNQPQARKTKSKRMEIEDLFSLNHLVKNKHILLVDDVYTTGNTMSEAVWELIKAGNKVSILIMALDE